MWKQSADRRWCKSFGQRSYSIAHQLHLPIGCRMLVFPRLLWEKSIDSAEQKSASTAKGTSIFSFGVSLCFFKGTWTKHLKAPVCFEIFVWERPRWSYITTLCLVAALSLYLWHETVLRLRLALHLQIFSIWPLRQEGKFYKRFLFTLLDVWKRTPFYSGQGSCSPLPLSEDRSTHFMKSGLIVPDTADPSLVDAPYTGEYLRNWLIIDQGKGHPRYCSFSPRSQTAMERKPIDFPISALSLGENLSALWLWAPVSGGLA